MVPTRLLKIFPFSGIVGILSWSLGRIQQYLFSFTQNFKNKKVVLQEVLLYIWLILTADSLFGLNLHIS